MQQQLGNTSLLSIISNESDSIHVSTFSFTFMHVRCHRLYPPLLGVCKFFLHSRLNWSNAYGSFHSVFAWSQHFCQRRLFVGACCLGVVGMRQLSWLCLCFGLWYVCFHQAHSLTTCLFWCYMPQHIRTHIYESCKRVCVCACVCLIL